MPCCKNEEAPHKAVPRGLLAAIDPAAAVQISQQLLPPGTTAGLVTAAGPMWFHQNSWSRDTAETTGLCDAVRTAGPKSSSHNSYFHHDNRSHGSSHNSVSYVVPSQQLFPS